MPVSLKTHLSLTRNMSDIEILNMELSKWESKLDGLKIKRISKESFKRISEVYRFLLDKVNVEESKAGFQIEIEKLEVFFNQLNF